MSSLELPVSDILKVDIWSKFVQMTDTVTGHAMMYPLSNREHEVRPQVIFFPCNKMKKETREINPVRAPPSTTISSWDSDRTR